VELTVFTPVAGGGVGSVAEETTSSASRFASAGTRRRRPPACAPICSAFGRGAADAVWSIYPTRTDDTGIS
jgi:hypothetical protein